MSAKSLNFAAELRDDLAKRFTTVSAVLFDSDGEPYIVVGSQAAGSQSALIKCKTTLPLGVNSINLSAVGYAGITVQIVEETSTIANTPLLTGANNLALLCKLGHMGAAVELYMSANTNAVGPEDIVTGNLKGTFWPDLKWKALSSI